MDQYQTVSKRFWAGVVDGFVFVPLGMLEQVIFSNGATKTLVVVWLIFYYPLSWLYSVVMHARYGQTLGKMATGIKVIDVGEDRPITWRQAFLRESVMIAINTAFLGYAIYLVMADVPKESNEVSIFDAAASLIVYGWFFAEIISCLTNRKCRAIHDFMAGTVVVRIK